MILINNKIFLLRKKLQVKKLLKHKVLLKMSQNFKSKYKKHNPKFKKRILWQLKNQRKVPSLTTINKKIFLSSLNQKQKKSKVKMITRNKRSHLFLMMMRIKIFLSNQKQKLQTSSNHNLLNKLFHK